MTNYAEKEDGYWLFEPIDSTLKDAPLIVFVHGYGGYNPEVYGSWIKHLVLQGNAVIFPRYQKHIFSPSPNQFAENVAVAICDVLDRMDGITHLEASNAPLVLIGHSYGGVISAALAAEYEEYGIPQPAGIMLCSPGTGPLSAGRLETYSSIPSSTLQIGISTEDDYVVGNEFAELVYATSGSQLKLYLHQFPWEQDSLKIGAHHNESYSYNETLNGGLTSPTIKRAHHSSKTNILDYNGYWDLADKLIAATRGQYDFGQLLNSTDVPFSIGLDENISIFEVRGSTKSENEADKKLNASVKR